MLHILPESQANILGVKVTGKFTSQDYKEFLVPRLKPIIEEHGGVRVLLYLAEDFQGRDLEALRHDGFGRRHKDNFQKIAVVGGSWWLSLELNLIAPLIAGELRNFSRAELPEAWTWIRK
jgi:hypothetical protein